MNEAVDRRHPRRALIDDEMRRLLAAAHREPVLWKMTGPERVLFYVLAVETGLRV